MITIFALKNHFWFIKIDQDFVFASEVKRLLHRFNEEGKLPIFDKIVAHQGILCEQVGEGEYRLKKVFNWPPRFKLNSKIMVRRASHFPNVIYIPVAQGGQANILF